MMDAGLKRPPGSESSSGNPANIQLENVRLIWLGGPAPERTGAPARDADTFAGGAGPWGRAAQIAQCGEGVCTEDRAGCWVAHCKG